MKIYTTNHSSMKKLRKIAAYWGTLGKMLKSYGEPLTLRGCVAYTQKHRPFKLVKIAVKVRQFSPEEREKRRIAADPVFRQANLKEAQVALKKLLPQKNVESVMAFERAFADRVIHAAQDKVLALGGKLRVVDRTFYAKLPVSMDFAKKVGVTTDKRNSYIASYFRSTFVHSSGVAHWRGRRPVGYTPCVRDQYVVAFGVVKNQIKCEFRVGIKKIKSTAKEGYAWGIDKNGLRLFSKAHGGDYHPTALEILDGVDLVQKVEENKVIRDQLLAQKRAEEASLQGVYVCLADAIRAGNCRAGTETFAARHKLDTKKHYGAVELLAIANGDESRVRLAVASATIRHRKEIKAGYSILMDHSA